MRAATCSSAPPCSKGFKPFGPPALVQQALPAILLAALRRFRAPTLTESVLPFGNPALKAETAKSFDLGIEHNFLDGAVRATATYYRRKSDNQIAFSFTTFQSENIAKVLNEGIELELDVRPTRTLKISAGYNLVNATNLPKDTF